MEMDFAELKKKIEDYTDKDLARILLVEKDNYVDEVINLVRQECKSRGIDPKLLQDSFDENVNSKLAKEQPKIREDSIYRLINSKYAKLVAFVFTLWLAFWSFIQWSVTFDDLLQETGWVLVSTVVNLALYTLSAVLSASIFSIMIIYSNRSLSKFKIVRIKKVFGISIYVVLALMILDFVIRLIAKV